MSSRTIFRYHNEAVGALVLLALLLFIGSVLQTGLLRDWFQPGATLKVVLPDEGLFGLSRGAKVEILGTPAGTVEEIVIEPGRKIHAMVEIREKMKVFVRRDSRAIIRKEFGVAGASYLEISRGTGEPLDWEYAVIKARAEQAPTESMGELLTELRTRVMPIMEDTQRLLANMNAITGAIAGGEGAVGRLLAEDRIVVQVEKLLDRLDASFAQLPPILQSLRASAGDLSTLSAELAELAGGVPQLSRRTGEILASLQSVTSDLSRTTPKLPGLIENVDDATGDLPVLLVQTREALSELTRLLQQLQSHWLLGGRKKRDAKARDRISPLEVSP